MSRMQFETDMLTVGTGQRAISAARSGYTLVEMVASMAIMTILMGAIASALVVSARAIPANDTPLEHTAEAARIVQQIANEMAVAIEFQTRTATAVAFTIADRNNDATAESITYSWAGSDGNPLLRKYNNEADETLADAVTLFDIGFGLRDTGKTVKSSDEGAETLLFSYTTATTQDRITFNANRYVAECFQPSLPADAESWSITRAFLMMNRNAGDGITGTGRIEIRTADPSWHPTTTILDEDPFVESDLGSSDEWEEFAFTKADGLDPNEPYCIVIASDDTSNVGRVTYDRFSFSPALYSTSSNQGASWSSGANYDCLFSVYGTVTTPGGTSTVYELTSARVKLQLAGDGARTVETAAEVLNLPEIIE